MFYFCYTIIFLLICASRTTPVSGEPLLNCSRVPEDQRNWSIKHNYCRLWAHTSKLVKDPGTGEPIIVIAGGMAKYRFEWEGQDWEVPDLHGDLDILRMGNDFTLDELPLEEARRNPKINGKYVPVVNRGYMWIDSSGQILLSGGHFYEDEYWDSSQYYVSTPDIPEWSIWRYNIAKDEWVELFPSGDSVIRSISTGYTSIPGTNKSYSAEGYWTQRSYPNAPPGVGMATDGIIVYDHTRNTIQNITDPAMKSGFAHGALHYIGTPEGNKGVLLSLMAKEYPLGKNFSDNDPLQGKSNNFTNLRFFSIEDNRWYTQRASFIDDNRPSTRTRFCSVLMQEEGTNTWQLYMLGGQSIEDPSKGPADIWVLTIPAMMWIQITNPFDNVQLKSQTCHAMGSSIVVMGGYPPSPPGTPGLGCDTRFVRIFDTTQQSWVGNFKANTTYKVPEEISYWARDKPASGWGSPELESIFSDITSVTSSSVTSTASSSTSTSPADDPTPTSASKGTTGNGGITDPAILGGGIGGGIGGAIIILIISIACYKIRQRRRQRLRTENAEPQSPQPNPQPPQKPGSVGPVEIAGNIALVAGDRAHDGEHLQPVIHEVGNGQCR